MSPLRAIAPESYRNLYRSAFGPYLAVRRTRETRAPIPAEPGRPARHDYEYRRCGHCNVFMAPEPLAGR